MILNRHNYQTVEVEFVLLKPKSRILQYDATQAVVYYIVGHVHRLACLHEGHCQWQGSEAVANVLLDCSYSCSL